MPANDFKPLANAVGANVLTQGQYEALTTFLANGFSSGVVPSNQWNKVARQTSVMAYVLAQWIMEKSGQDVLDNGSPATIVTNLTAAVNAMIAAATSGIPVGSTILVPATAAPTGYIKANGALISRTTYAALWTYAQASGNLAASDGAWGEGQFSPGDGSTTFRIPDLRGNFMRAWDDGRGIDLSRAIGSLQLDALQGHWHQYYYSGAQPGAGGGFQGVQSTNNTPGNNDVVRSPIADGTNGTPRTAAETRPRNVSLLACIKF